MRDIGAAEAIGWLTTAEAAYLLERRPSTVRYWSFRGWLPPGRQCADGVVRHRLDDLLDAERRARRGAAADDRGQVE